MRVRMLTAGVLVVGFAANASGGSGPPVAVDPAPPPITMAALHNLVSPAVVALLVSGGPAPAHVVPGVLTTASGFVLTSRSAVAEAVDGRAMLTMLRAGPGGRLGTRDLCFN